MSAAVETLDANFPAGGKIEGKTTDEVDHVIGEVTSAIKALPDEGMEPRPTVREQMAARRRRLEGLRSSLGGTRQIVAKLVSRAEQLEAERQTTLQMLASLQQKLDVPEVRGGYAEWRDRKSGTPIAPAWRGHEMVSAKDPARSSRTCTSTGWTAFGRCRCWTSC